jgi:hypothetical protein
MKNSSLVLRLFQAFAIAALFAAIAGCYTLVKHPRVTTEDRYDEYGDRAPITYADDCAACHESDAYFLSHGYLPPIAGGYDRWRHYYEYPWWISYYSGHDRNSSDKDSTAQERPFGRRVRRAGEESQPSQPATEGSSSGTTIISKTGNSGSGQTDPKPAEKENPRGGDSDKDKRRERKP